MMFNKNLKAMVCSSNDDIKFFDIVTGILQGDTLAPYLFIICLDYVQRTSIYLINENGFKKTSRQYPTESMIEADYADDLVLLTNTYGQAESLLHSLEQTARHIACVCVCV